MFLVSLKLFEINFTLKFRIMRQLYLSALLFGAKNGTKLQRINMIYKEYYYYFQDIFNNVYLFGH